MFDGIEDNLYIKKSNLLYKQGKLDGKIVPFDNSFYEELSKTYISSIPVSIHIKYLKPDKAPMKCIDRSLYMFFAIDNSLLVRGNSRYIKILSGKGTGKHGWIERDNYVYDPTYTERFDKDLYYKIFGLTDISKYTKEEYCSIDRNRELYEEIKSATIEDYKPSGKRRMELGMSIPLIKGIAQMSNDKDFISDLDSFLEEINYDEEQIYNEVNRAFQKMINDKYKKIS